MPCVRGDRLKPEAKAEALRQFIYRWTSQNPMRGQCYKRCPVCGVVGGRPDDPSDAPAPRYVAPVACRKHHPTVAFVTDAEWLRAHAFTVTKRGTLHARTRAMPWVFADDYKETDEEVADRCKSDAAEATSLVKDAFSDWHKSCKVED